MPSSAPETPRRRGGARPGAGRRPTFDRATINRTYSLDERTLEAIAAWCANPRNKAESASEALRQMVDVATRVANGMPHPCPECGAEMRSWKPGATCARCARRKGGYAKAAALHTADG